ncbi:MAG: KGG domain-containing protein [Candidatus Saccharimonadales bacterium]
MAGKPNDQWMKTMIEKHGSREAVREIMMETGSRGGSAPTTYPKGFASMTPEKRSLAGRKGGAVTLERYKRSNMGDTWLEKEPKKLTTTSTTKRRVRCASCHDLFNTAHLDEMGLCMTCPVDERSRLQKARDLFTDIRDELSGRNQRPF